MTTAAPDYWLGFTSLGAFYFNRDRIDDALAAWHRSVELAPRDATTLNNLGAIHFKRNEWAAARAMFQQAFHIRPDCESCNNVATALYFDRKYDESAHYFEYAIQYCDTNDCRTFGNLASALYWTDGGRNRADAVYRRAIGKALAGLGRKPGDPELTSFLIDYYVMSDDTAGAQTTIAHASNKALENPRVLYSIGSAYEKMGRRELALRYLASAVHRGFTLSVVEQAPVLADLVKDPMFDEVVRKAAADAGATAATDKH
jgi:serine/threonine-protein kinase